MSARAHLPAGTVSSAASPAAFLKLLASSASLASLASFASLASLASLTLLAGCSSGSTARVDGPRSTPVSIARVEVRDVPVTLSAIGSVESVSTVAVKAQVGGELRRVAFEEGQDVRRGSVLFEIDPRPFEAALQQAKAQLDRDRAQLANAKGDSERYAGLVDKDYITPSEYDKIHTAATALEATVQADEAAVKSASLQLEFCTIRSPVDGRTGQLMVHAGNVVKANADTPMVVIEKMDPIYVSFSVPEQRLLEIKRRQADGTLHVEATVPDSEAAPVAGRLSFIDNSVDSSTGTVLLKATFANPDRILWPGQFVTVRLTLSTLKGARIVPTQAIQTGQEGSFVFVVKPDSTVESRQVSEGEAWEHDTVIEKGLEAGETVVTDGQLGLVPGMKVTPKTAPASGAPEGAGSDNGSPGGGPGGGGEPKGSPQSGAGADGGAGKKP
jgi:multidrug efflux system membrane fusion protein